MKKKCSRCGQTKPLSQFYSHPHTTEGKGSYCKECYKEYQRKWRDKNREKIKTYCSQWNKNHREQRNLQQRKRRKGLMGRLEYCARQTTEKAWRSGKIKKENCVMCGSEAKYKHHPDYTKPLDIVWLCPACHYIVHKERGDYASTKSF